jgi:two-component system sensor histidine kinase NreB
LIDLSLSALTPACRAFLAWRHPVGAIGTMTHTYVSSIISQPDNAAGRVLVVDDDAGIRKLVTKVLSEIGHNAETAAGVDEALVQLASKHYDVVLVDLEMPVRNGLELLEQISADERDVIPILLSGTREVRTAVAAMKRGAFDYLSKPVELEPLCWAVARGIAVARTRRRERRLERIASEWAATFDACQELLIVLDGDGLVLQANQAARRLFQRDDNPLVGRGVEEAFPGQLGPTIVDCQLRLQAGETIREISLLDSFLGGHFLVSVNALPVPRGASLGVVVVARDVTDRVHAEESRVRLVRQVLSAQEDERRRIAKELHDGVGQALVSLTVGLAAIAQESTTAELNERIERLGRVASESLDDIRRLSHGLRPTILDDLGLVAALSRMTEVFTRVHGIRAELVAPGERIERLPTELESAVYRIVQEALTNVAKHAQAQTVDVIIETIDRTMRVSVTDDGLGFEPSKYPGAHAGCGLSGMWERSLMLGGTFRIDSVPGRGTTIDVRIPIGEHSL